MSFWIVSAAVLVATGLLLAWPLLRAGAGIRGLGPLLVLVVPVLGFVLYTGVGTPEAIDMPRPQPRAAQEGAPADHQMDSLVAGLEARLAEDPENLEGWMLLGRSYKSMQRFDDALAALQRAETLAPDNPLVQVELAEAELFASGEPMMSDAIIARLEGAVAADPTSQKGLWLLGMAAAQRGDDLVAIERWERVLALLDPESGTADSVRAQIEEARNRLATTPPLAATEEPPQAAGVTTEPPEAADAPPSGEAGTLAVRVTLDPAAAGVDASRATLFVYARPPGAGGGMPLAVKRISAPSFPVDLSLNDADALMPGVTISTLPEVEISATLSLSGSANPTSGDVRAEARTASMTGDTAVQLVLNDIVP